jgi:hypothetical protein
MAWRQLGDGSWWNENTGELRGLDETKEAAARAIAIRRGQYRPKQYAAPTGPRPPTPTQTMVALPQASGVQAIIQPGANLAVNPYELGMGGQSRGMGFLGNMGALSDQTKRFIAIGGLVAAACGVVYLERKFGGGAAKKH